jgi:hypothetical protein
MNDNDEKKMCGSLTIFYVLNCEGEIRESGAKKLCATTLLEATYLETEPIEEREKSRFSAYSQLIGSIKYQFVMWRGRNRKKKKNQLVIECISIYT